MQSHPRDQGKLYTPPARLPLLDGIYRRHLLETGQVEEKLLTLKDLEVADRVYACNALRGLYPLEFTRKGGIMKLIFLHGLGRMLTLGKGSKMHFPPCILNLLLFSLIQRKLPGAKERLTECLQQESEPFNSGWTLTGWRSRS